MDRILNDDRYLPDRLSLPPVSGEILNAVITVLAQPPLESNLAGRPSKIHAFSVDGSRPELWVGQTREEARDKHTMDTIRKFIAEWLRQKGIRGEVS